jgi:hypothetical protein
MLSRRRAGLLVLSKSKILFLNSYVYRFYKSCLSPLILLIKMNTEKCVVDDIYTSYFEG